MAEDMALTALALALENALKFKGKANPKAVMGGLMKAFPELRRDAARAHLLAADAVASSANLSFPDGQEARLLELRPDFKEARAAMKAKRKVERSSLPELKGAVKGAVVTRIPPEPSKYNHMGHAMSFLINYLYAKKYGGRAILRFDDTNPEKSAQEYVDAVFEDVVDFLGVKPDTVKYASDHMREYYGYAERLIDEGHAYACSCPREEMQKRRREGKSCGHRNRPLEENKAVWERMKRGEFDEGEVVLRLKVDMQHKNAVMRDPVIYRLSYAEHYRQGGEFKVWPMYDFECAVEEGLCGVTHVMRSNEFDSRIELQNHIASLFGFPLVQYTHYGRYNVTGASTQGREIREGIERGDFLGWDDPRLVTIRALRRRGIVREAFYELAQKIGLSKSQTNLDFSVIASVNRALLDRDAKRFFAVRDPIVVTVKGIPDAITSFVLSHHPDVEKGNRVLKASSEYYIERSDNDAVPVGGRVRFMDAMNVEKMGASTYRFLSTEYAEVKGRVSLIHFVPKDGSEVRAELLMPDLSVVPLVCEPDTKAIPEGEVIQFERFAFCRLDDVQGLKFWFTHE